MWIGSATTPDLFSNGASFGQWTYTSLIQPEYGHNLAGQANLIHNDADFGVKGLDTKFAYDGKYVAIGIDIEAGDSPGFDLLPAWSAASLGIHGWTWMLYQPPPGGAGLGTTWVPLHEWDWSAAGTATNNNSTWTMDAGTSGITLNHFITSIMPDWDHLLVGD
jgi:hypothetical protein